MRPVLILVGVLCAASLFSGGKTESDNKTIELKAWHYFGEGTTAGVAFQKVVTDFNQSHPGIHVTPQFLPREELLKQYTVGRVGNNLPDIGMVDNPDHASFASSGLFLPIDDYLKDWDGKGKYFEGAWLSANYEGKQYGIPYVSNCLALWYNKDMFAAKGIDKVPETWDELFATAKKLTEGDVYGLAIALKKNEAGTFQFLPWLLSSGGSIDALGSPESVKALSYINMLVNEGVLSRESLNWGQGDAEKQFRAGRAAMMVNGPWIIPGMVEANLPFKWAIAKVPRDKKFTSVLGGENFGIIASTKHPDEAWAFLEYMSRPDVMRDYSMASNMFPPRRDVMENNAFWKDDPLLAVYTDEMKYARPRGPHPSWPEISLTIITAVHEAIVGNKTPQAAFQDAQAKLAGLF